MIPGSIYRWYNTEVYVMFLTPTQGVLGKLSVWMTCNDPAWVKVI
jgi:hypothetical protein